jgi:hypothetical protein
MSARRRLVYSPTVPESARESCIRPPATTGPGPVDVSPITTRRPVLESCILTSHLIATGRPAPSALLALQSP